MRIPTCRGNLRRKHSYIQSAAVHEVKKKNDQCLRDLMEFVPFVIETGGRLAQTTYQWLDSSWKDVTEERARKLQQAAVGSICVDVQRQLFMSNQSNMLSKFARRLTAIREAQ